MTGSHPYHQSILLIDAFPYLDDLGTLGGLFMCMDQTS